jgi:hypothetical protein
MKIEARMLSSQIKNQEKDWLQDVQGAKIVLIGPLNFQTKGQISKKAKLT